MKAPLSNFIKRLLRAGHGNALVSAVLKARATGKHVIEVRQGDTVRRFVPVSSIKIIK